MMVPLIDANQCPEANDICSQSSCSSSIAMADTMSHFAQNVDSSYLDEFGGGLESKDEGETVGNFLRTGGANRGYINALDIPEEPGICDFCLGQNGGPDCGPNTTYVTKEDMDKLETLIKANQDVFAQNIQDQIGGSAATIGTMLSEGNKKIIKKIMKNQLQNSEWFKKQDENMKDIFTNHAYLKTNQKDILTKLTDVSQQIKDMATFLENNFNQDTHHKLETHFGDNVKVLKNGLRMWDRVEFLDDGSGGYKAGNSYYNEYAKHYRDEVPNALQGFIDMLKGTNGPFSHKSIWAEENGFYCNYKDYFDHLLSMSMIHRCEVLYFKNERCSTKELVGWLEDKRQILINYENHCWAPPSSIEMLHRITTNNESKMHHLETLAGLPKDTFLFVRCSVYDAKPAATITWEYKGKKLVDWNPEKCLDTTLHDVKCFQIRKSEKRQKNDPSLWTTNSILQLNVGRKSPSELKCLAHHPALNSPQRTAVTLEMVDKGLCFQGEPGCMSVKRGRGRMWKSLLAKNLGFKSDALGPTAPVHIATPVPIAPLGPIFAPGPIAAPKPIFAPRPSNAPMPIFAPGRSVAPRPSANPRSQFKKFFHGFNYLNGTGHGIDGFQ